MMEMIKARAPQNEWTTVWSKVRKRGGQSVKLLLGWFWLVGIAEASPAVELLVPRVQEEAARAWYTSAELNSQNVWIVATSRGLNCRLEPSVSSPLVYGGIPLFETLVAYDLVGSRGVQNEGMMWLRVLPHGPVRPKPCYVVAEPRFIQPDFPDVTWQGSLTQIGEDNTCAQNIKNSVNRVRLLTKTHLIYLCSQFGPTVPQGQVSSYLSFRRDSQRSEPDLVLFNPSFDPTAGGQFVFRNGQYSYLIDQPSFRYPASFLSVIYPNGSGYDELIIEWLD